MKTIEVIVAIIFFMLVIFLLCGMLYDSQDDENRTTPRPTAKPTPKVLREIKCDLSYYCCEDMGSRTGTTANGVKLTDGIKPERNIAACNWLPFGSKLDINGTIYYVEDRGPIDYKDLSRFGRLDLYEYRGVEQCKINGRDKNVVVKLLKRG